MHRFLRQIGGSISGRSSILVSRPSLLSSRIETIIIKDSTDHSFVAIRTIFSNAEVQLDFSNDKNSMLAMNIFIHKFLTELL